MRELLSAFKNKALSALANRLQANRCTSALGVWAFPNAPSVNCHNPQPLTADKTPGLHDETEQHDVTECSHSMGETPDSPARESLAVARLDQSGIIRDN